MVLHLYSATNEPVLFLGAHAPRNDAGFVAFCRSASSGAIVPLLNGVIPKRLSAEESANRWNASLVNEHALPKLSRKNQRVSRYYRPSN